MNRTILLLTAGVAVGAIGLGIFNFTLEATSTETFCLSCHEMQIPKDRLMMTSHGSNKFGVVAQCSDCHVPKPFVAKMVRKISASREVWEHLLGTIDTPEKYEAHRETMRQRELDRIVASDSAECRGCHQTDRWLLEEQSNSAQKKHNSMMAEGKTCISCHDDVGHPVELADAEDAFGF